MTTSIPDTFRDANYNVIRYDGSPVSWRVSIYGICINNDKILLLKHQNEKFYDIPGGGVEMGEDLAQALAREGREETGWNVTPIRPIFETTDWFYHNGEKRFYKSLQLHWLADGKPTGNPPSEPLIKEVIEVPFDELDSYEVYPNLKVALQHYFDSLSQH